jgi:hypothetical protein
MPNPPRPWALPTNHEPTAPARGATAIRAPPHQSPEPPHHRLIATPNVVAEIRAADAVEPGWIPPRELTIGKSKARSLMQPQPLAKRLLPAATYETLVQYSMIGVPTNCGPDWPEEAVQAARAMGPHVSAMTPENVKLIWEDVQYQADARFVNIVPESDLFAGHVPTNLKISRLAVVPQRNRRGRLILNLSAEVELPPNRISGSRRKTKRTQPSVNESTQPAADQEAVKRLGTAMVDALMLLFDSPCGWEVLWSKIDLSDGFWRMIVEAGQEPNFVYELPDHPEREGKWFVIPSALQMGWTNSPAYFCSTTEATLQVIGRLLALTAHDGKIDGHPHEVHCAIGDQCHPWPPQPEFLVLLRVFVDDFIVGMAGPPDRQSRSAEVLWLSRATLHGIHSIFPPPSITGHTDGRDSISVKKLIAKDGQFRTDKMILGFALRGEPGNQRTVGLSAEKATSYIDHIHEALARPQKYISKAEFQKIHGRLVHAAQVMPCMGGLMSELNRVLASAHITVGLGNKAPLRDTLEDFAYFLEQACNNPSHITEIVGTDLPHLYGYTDACRSGMGGVILPATKWLQPTVWRARFPEDVVSLFDKGQLSINDLELAANFAAERTAEHMLGGHIAGLNSWFGSDNTATVSWKTKKAARAQSRSRFAPQVLRAEALLQRYTRRGPQDIGHIEGTRNLLGDFPSRSFDEGFDANTGGDAAFLLEFSHRHPLPPQLGCWMFVPLTDAIFSVTCSMLRGTVISCARTKTGTGDTGPPLPCQLANILSYRTPRDRPTTWNELCCSWPLLSPCGKVTSTMAEQFAERKSRGRYVSAPNSWSHKDFATLAKQIHPTTASHPPSPPF